MIIISSQRQYFIKPNGEEGFVGRRVQYEENGEIKNKFVNVNQLPENVEYQDIVDYIGGEE